jgi:prostaglandin-E synthase 1
MDLQGNPAFPVFAVCAAILVVKMLLVGHYTGVKRMRKKAYLNPEDAQQFSGTDEYQATEDPEIERGLRAHRNDLESTLPFFAIGLIYLLMGASSCLATWLFVIFTALRCVFSVFYLRGMQPWRSLSFLLAEACMVVMLIQILYWGISG